MIQLQAFNFIEAKWNCCYYRDWAVPVREAFSYGIRGIFLCDSMKYKVLFHGITMKYAISRIMKMSHIQDCAICITNSRYLDVTRIHCENRWQGQKKMFISRRSGLEKMNTSLQDSYISHYFLCFCFNFKTQKLSSKWQHFDKIDSFPFFFPAVRINFVILIEFKALQLVGIKTCTYNYNDPQVRKHKDRQSKMFQKS